MASFGRNYLTWYEVRTIIYLKVSISDFLTLFSARTRTWFWERNLGGPLLIAAVVALTISTIFALFWDRVFGGLGESAYMAGLADSKGAVFSVWLYCILWWVIQDGFKVWTYWLLDLRRELGSWGLVWETQKVHVLGGTKPSPPGQASTVRNPAFDAGAGGGGGKKVSTADW